MSTAQAQLEVSRLIRADQQRVFAAWTDPAQIVQWWGAGGVVCTQAEMDLVVGGTYRIANKTPEGATMWITGTFEQVDPPRQLIYTWATEPVTVDTDHSLVNVSFEPTDDGTMVTVTQTQIATPQAREIHLQGWIGCLQGLDDLLSA